MSDNPAARIAVLEGKNRRNPLAMYITEILEGEGYGYRLVTVPEECGLLIVPDIEMAPGIQEAVRQFAESGGRLLALRPGPGLWPLFGLEKQDISLFTWADRYLRLRDGQRLQCRGPADLLHADGCEILANLQYDFEDGPSAHPALVCAKSGGRRAAFTFDLARCVALFHQGRADQAGDGPNPDPDGDGMFKPNDLFINYLDPRLKLIPQADVLQSLFTDLVGWLTEEAPPVPRFWRFPHAQPALAFFTGDSDGASAEDLRLAFETAESFGLSYTLYLMTQDFPKIAPEEAQALQAAGHEVGLHPWHAPAPTVPEFREHLILEYGGFSDRYGYTPATVRNHSCIIAGWVETPAIYSEIGVRMDLNPYPIRGFQYGFLTGTALPAKYMDASARMVNCYQQPTLTSDDGMLEAKCGLPALSIDEAVRASAALLDSLCDTYHGVYQPCFHPIRMRAYPPPALEWYKAMLARVRDKNLLSLSGLAWSRFNDARRSARLVPQNGSWLLQSPEAVEGLTILWPERVKSVSVNGEPQALNRTAWSGRERCMALNIGAKSEARIEVGV
ncbi:MAG: hypothetical protein IT210_12195 [Armatimonadetes bacterium]|nr:hypothetical protein [Armatimonadota bacterium]